MKSTATDGILPDTDTAVKRPCALLWDESFLWGVMAWKALSEAGLPFVPVRSEDIRKGGLSRYRMVFVPGGWASNKIAALGEQGREEIRRFVAAGGSYLGICGGAGMATKNGLGLLSIRRRATAERVPSFSGPIRLSQNAHEIWRNVDVPVFNAWWPSQFQIDDPAIRVLGRYDDPLPDAFSSDIRVADGNTGDWTALEKAYGILLNPARLSGEPAVVEGSFGCGRVVLSLVHFDTPGDRNGSVVLRNLWSYLSCGDHRPAGVKSAPARFGRGLPRKVAEMTAELQAKVRELIAIGAGQSLWYWRNPLLLQWRRGVRGLEYSTLAVMIGEIAESLGNPAASDPETPAQLPAPLDPAVVEEELLGIREGLFAFCEKARGLLVREKQSMSREPLSPTVCADEEISRLRGELFGSAMSHGGDFKRLIDAVDRLLYKLIVNGLAVSTGPCFRPPRIYDGGASDPSRV